MTATFDLLPLPTVVLEADGTVSEANRAAAELLRVPREEIVGRSWCQFVSEEDRPRIEERWRRRAAGEPVPTAYEARLAGAAGPVAVEIRVSVDGTRRVAQLIDRSDEAARVELLASLARLGASVQRELSQDAVQRRVRDGLLALGVRSVWAAPSDGQVRLAWVETGPGPERALLEGALGAPLDGFEAPPTPLADRVWGGEAVFTDEWPEEAERWFRIPVAPVLRDLPPAGAYHRAIGLRVDAGGTPAAMLFAVGGWLRPGDLPAFQLFASQISAALAAAREVTELSERNRDLAALNRLADAAASAPSLDAFFVRAEEIARAATGCNAVAILLVDEDRGEARLAHEGRLAPEIRAISERIPPRDPRTAALLRSGAPLVRHPGEFGHELDGAMARAGVGTAVAVPLRFRSGALGLLTVDYLGPPRDAAAARTDLLQAMASQVATTIETHRLLESLRRRVDELTLLNDVPAATVTLDPRAVIDGAMRRIAATLRADLAGALLADGDRLVPVALLGLAPEDVAGAPGGIRGTIAQRAFDERAPVRADRDVGEPGDARRAWFRERHGIRSAIAVPILAKERVLGSVVIARRDVEPFSEGQERLLSAVGAQLGLVVENARLYADLRASYAELGRAQEQLIRKERLAALGELAAVVAHEVRNPLGAIFNSLGALRRLVQPEGDARTLFDILGEEADRLNRIVGDLLDFARPAQPRVQPEPLDRVVDEAAAAALAGAPGVHLERDLPPDLPPVPLDGRLVRQALLNVMSNAVQAMPDGGTLTVRARSEDGAVRLEIDDTGCGIPSEVRHRIFEPFFTTRPTGTGLGLAVVKRILGDHRGTIDVESREGGGTRFVLRLPLRPPVDPRPPLWAR